MLSSFLLQVQVFLLILCILNIIRDGFEIINMFYSNQGNNELKGKRLLFFGLSLSYLITIIITGFIR